jgi:L-aminopeptidase/D-esterase-like protein
LATGSAAQLPSGFTVGQAQDIQAGTGCTVILAPEGAVGGVAVRGGAPATRETDLLDPLNLVQQLHAVILSGGSAFGLDAAGGVMRYLEEKGIGIPFSDSCVPIVCGASLFDLSVGDATVRPDAAMGYAACAAAAPALAVGNVGAGCGASVGKLLGADHAMKSGLGAASIQIDELIVCALVAVNALGTVVDRATGTALAGSVATGSDGKPVILGAHAALDLLRQSPTNPFAANTTIGCVLTNAALDKVQSNRLASVTHDALARAIEPVHSSFDGDAVFALAQGSVQAHPDVVAVYATTVMEQAIYNAVRSAEAAYGLIASSSFQCDAL